MESQKRWTDDEITKVIYARFEGGCTLEVIGKHFGVSTERIRQILIKAIGTTGGNLKRK